MSLTLGVNVNTLWSHALAFQAGQLYGCRYAQLAVPSVEGATLLPPSSVDIAFIDGDHQYAAVTKDIAAWRKTVKSRGTLLFNDYNPRWPGVERAVDEFAANTSQTLWWLPEHRFGNVGLVNIDGGGGPLSI